MGRVRVSMHVCICVYMCVCVSVYVCAWVGRSEGSGTVSPRMRAVECSPA